MISLDLFKCTYSEIQGFWFLAVVFMSGRLLFIYVKIQAVFISLCKEKLH